MKLKNLLDKLIKSSQRINRYYSLTNFYSFLLSTVIKGLILFFLFILLIFCIDFFFIDLELLIKNSFEKYSSVMLMSIFFISESFLGLIPLNYF